MTELLAPAEVAQAWEEWCGETRWSRAMRRLEGTGIRVRWWCGYPRSASAIPLTFTLYGPTGERLEGSGRLRDLEAVASKSEVAS